MPIQNYPNSHDRFFKKSMSHPKVAREFFEFHLPREISSKVDFNSLKLEKGSFLDNTLGEGIVDMLFSAEYCGASGYFYVLVEHQSQPDYWMSFRMSKYILRICDNHLKKHPKSKSLPLVYPMVLYPGKEKYNYPTDLWGLYKDPTLAKAFFTEPFQLIELQKIKDSELKKRVWSGVMEYLMKRIYEKDIYPYLNMIFALLQEVSNQSIDYMETILYYTFERGETEVTREELLSFFKQTFPDDKKEYVMTIAEKIRLEGELQGRAEIARVLLAEGLDLELITKATSLPIEKLLEIQKELKH